MTDTNAPASATAPASTTPTPETEEDRIKREAAAKSAKIAQRPCSARLTRSTNGIDSRYVCFPLAGEAGRNRHALCLVYDRQDAQWGYLTVNGTFAALPDPTTALFPTIEPLTGWGLDSEGIKDAVGKLLTIPLAGPKADALMADTACNEAARNLAWSYLPPDARTSFVGQVAAQMYGGALSEGASRLIRARFAPPVETAPVAVPVAGPTRKAAPIGASGK